MSTPAVPMMRPQQAPRGHMVELPPPNPNCPMVVQVLSAPFFKKPRQGEEEGESIMWVIGQPHPLVASVKVMRMFHDPVEGVHIYSVSEDGTHGMRDLIPLHHVKLIEEAMSLEVFIEELGAAEDGDGELPDDPDPAEPPAATNGQPTTT